MIFGVKKGVDMSEVTKTLKEWEREIGFILTGDADEKKKYTEEEIHEVIQSGKTLSVDYKFRLQYLASKGIAATRENIANADL